MIFFFFFFFFYVLAQQELTHINVNLIIGQMNTLNLVYIVFFIRERCSVFSDSC